MLFLPPEMDEQEAVRSAAQAGVRIYPGAPYHVPRPGAAEEIPPAILMGFTGLEEDQIVEGVRCLARAWRPLLVKI